MFVCFLGARSINFDVNSISIELYLDFIETHLVFVSDCKLLSKLPQGQWITHNPFWRAHATVNAISIWPPNARPPNFRVFAFVLGNRTYKTTEQLQH